MLLSSSTPWSNYTSQNDHQKISSHSGMGVPVLNISQCRFHSSSSSNSTYHVKVGLNTSCYIHLKVPPDETLQIRAQCSDKVDLFTWQYEGHNRLFPCRAQLWCYHFYYTDFLSWTDSLVLVFQARYLWTRVELTLTAVEKTKAPTLKLFQRFPNVGVIQTPSHYDRYVSTCAKVTLPTRHVLFLNINATFQTGRRKYIPLRWFRGHCGHAHAHALHEVEAFQHYPAIFPDGRRPLSERPLRDTTRDERNRSQDTALSFLYYGYSNSGHPVQYTFSFLPRRPEQIGEQWNCSQSAWPALYRHFPCDLTAQCADAEDETVCFYHSESCQPAQIGVEDNCFFILESKQTGYLNGYTCRQQGASFATFDSTAQWDAVVRAVRSSPYFGEIIKIDLHRTTSPREIWIDTYLRNMYAESWRWGQGSIAYNFHPTFYLWCAHGYFRSSRSNTVASVLKSCVQGRTIVAYPITEITDKVLCRTHPSPNTDTTKNKTLITATAFMNKTASPVSLVTCDAKHMTHVLLACDPYTLCSGKLERRGLSHTAMCRVPGVHTPAPYFKCEGTEQYVPYSVVCDWMQDCGDNSDESFCQFPPCRPGSFNCGGKQCLNLDKTCDSIMDCTTLLDEYVCNDKYLQILGRERVTFHVINPPAVVNFDRQGYFTLTPLPRNSSQCPDTHFLCPTHGYCLPVFTRCNGMTDCPGDWDEADCDAYTCEGMYQCRGRGRRICMHVKHLCDGWHHCPQHDDELMCNPDASCLDGCVCYGTKFTHHNYFQLDAFAHIRYLEGRGSGVTVGAVANLSMLIYFGAAACGWRNLTDIPLPGLHALDISDNLLHSVHFGHFTLLRHLKDLDLSGNPLSFGFVGVSAQHVLLSLLMLNLSRIPGEFSQFPILAEFTPFVQVIDLSYSHLTSLQGRALFRYLHVLDLEGCPISDLSPDFLKGLEELQELLADNFKLCCPVILPDSFAGKCTAPTLELSSCDNLLKADSYRIALAFFTIASLFGNLCSFVYRLWPTSRRRTIGYVVFVIHLSVSDFFMGVYLLMIGVADRLYSGNYLWNDLSWKRSAACSISGFMSLVSCEVSSIFICLITLDRFLVICFPFSRLRFGTRSAYVACTVTWALGGILASVPLLPVTSHWAFYSQTGICIPLPVTRADFPGRHYSFGVMIVFNLVLFLLIAVGQALIFWSVRANTMSDDGPKGKDTVNTNNKSRSKEAAVARRLLTIAMSDFLCWFPIGVCGLLAKLDVPVPGEVNVAMAIFVLPFNSALNPFLYTYTIIIEKLRKQKERELHKFVTSEIQKALGALSH